MFLVIIFSLSCKNRPKEVTTDSKSKSDYKKHLTIAITLSILFGLGWGFGIPATQGISIIAVRTIFQALFIVLTSFQGLFIFIMQCLRSPIARETWWEWYYTVTCRRDDYKRKVRGTSTLNRSTQKWRKTKDKSGTLSTAGIGSSTLERVLESSTLQRNVSETEFTSSTAENPETHTQSVVRKGRNLPNRNPDTENVVQSLTLENPGSNLQTEVINELSDTLGSSVVSPQTSYNIVFKQKEPKPEPNLSLVCTNENVYTEVELHDLGPVASDNN